MILRTRNRYSRHRRSDSLPIALGIFLLSLTLLTLFYNAPTQKTLIFPSLTLRQQISSEQNAQLDKICNVEDGQPTPFLKSKPALSILIPSILILFIGLAVVTDDFFVPALERICEKLDLSEDVAGATFMAAGSSAPELFTSLLATFVTKDDVGVGTIVGSAVFNVLVIIGVSAIMAGKILQLDWRPLVRDSVFYAMSIVLLLVFTLGSSRGEIGWWEGLILMSGYVGYIAFMKWGNWRYMKFCKRWVKGAVLDGEGVDLEKGIGGESSGDSPMGSQETEESREVGGGVDGGDVGFGGGVVTDRSKYRDLHPRFKFRVSVYTIIAANHFARGSHDGFDEGAGEWRDVVLPENGGNELVGNIGSEEVDGGKQFLGVDVPKSMLGKALFPVTFFWQILFKYTIIPNCAEERFANWWPATFILSIVWIGGISYAMVEAARLTGCLIGVPSAVMGLTVLAAGTSIPDALASVAVAKQGQGDMAVSNAIGSNVFDILLGLGLPTFLGGLINKKPLPVTVDPIGTVVIPIAILFGVLIVLLAVTAAMKWKLRPMLGYVLLGIYFLFVAYSFLDAFVFEIGVPG